MKQGSIEVASTILINVTNKKTDAEMDTQTDTEMDTQTDTEMDTQIDK